MNRLPAFDAEIPQTVAVGGFGLPLLVMALLAFGLPWLLAPRATRSHVEVAVAVWAAAGLTLLAGAGLFAWIYAEAGSDVRGAFSAMPLATIWYLLKPSLLAVLAWGPGLALAWFALAQRVEKRRGEDLARRGRK